MILTQEAFRAHRRKLLDSMEPGSIAIIPSAREVIRSRDTHFSFRQNSDFYYLSGFNEPESLIVLVPGRPAGEFMIFCRERNPEHEIWEGLMAGPEGAVERYSADEAFKNTDRDTLIPELMDGCTRVYYPLGQDAQFDAQVMTWLSAVRAKARAGAKAPQALANLDQLLHEQRLIKTSAELEVMRVSCELAAQAHIRVMKSAPAAEFEYQLEADILHTFARAGARAAAYNTIVGSGRNGCILHYTENDAPLKDGDLILIDAGCEYGMYAADITRTFPRNGRFSEPQKALYELVLKAQDAVIKMLRPGVLWNEPHDMSVKILTDGLIDLGLLKGDLDELIKSGAYKRFYMHRVGHWLGIDVHDVGAYKTDEPLMGEIGEMGEMGEMSWRKLEPGMVMTVEPGLYIANDDETVDEKWRGIGIRIEDDVVITAQGCEVMTASAPKSVADIEALMA